MLVHLSRICASLAVAIVCLVPLRGAAADDLSRAYLLPELFEIMAEEGRSAALEDGAATLSGRSLATYERVIARIYDADLMHADFNAALMAELEDAPDVVADALDFARTELGQNILQLEISARRALLDEAVDDIARANLAQARSPDASDALATRLEMVRQRVDANDLIEMNVSLGLNNTFSYYRGLMAENALADFGPEQMVQMVWMQEDAIRTDVEDWIESYFLLAYQPLEDSELQTYIDVVSTPLGQAFNRAMFAAFDTVFNDISMDVGRALGRGMGGEDL